MDIIMFVVDFIVHLDKHLGEIIQAWGGWSYLLLFVIVFCETGLVITPFLPGDSLLFVVGAFAALGSFDPFWVFVVLAGAAIIGDSVNYAIGKYFGEWILVKGKGRFIRKEHIEETHRFFERHGGKTIVLARFVPIIRTFAPFVAGLGTMQYRKFIIYNITGGVLWVATFLLGGYFFGNIPVVKKNFMMVVLGVIVVSVLPIIYGYIHSRLRTKDQPNAATPADVPSERTV